MVSLNFGWEPEEAREEVMQISGGELPDQMEQSTKAIRQEHA